MSESAGRASSAAALCVLACLPALWSGEDVGDTRPAIDCAYPRRVFSHAGKGGHFIDVTKPPFNARGDGRTDDTRAVGNVLDRSAAGG